MKYYPRLKQYKAYNVIFDETKQIAYSYDWYELAKRINGTMVLNSYGYSNSTTKHCYKIRRLFGDLKIQYVSIQAPRGLQDLNSAKQHYQLLIENLRAQIIKPRSREKTNIERGHEIKRHINAINIIENLMRANQ